MAVQSVWFGALRLAFRDLFTPLSVVEVASPSLVAGVLRRTDRSDRVVHAGMFAGGLTGLGVLFVTVLPRVLCASIAGIAWLVAVTADPSIPSVETVVVDGFVAIGGAILGAGMAFVFVAVLAAVPGLIGGLLAYGLRAHVDAGTGLAGAEDAGS